MKNKFRYVNEIKFKDRTYAIFDNEGYKVFLRKLETDDFDESVDLGNSIKSTKLVYTDIDEFTELNKIFNHKLKLINAMIEDDSEAKETHFDEEDDEADVEDADFDEDDFSESLEIKLEKGKYYRFPMRVYRNGEFISLAQAIEETGFGIARKEDAEFEENGEEVFYDSATELFSSKKIEVEAVDNGEYRIKAIKQNPRYIDSVFVENANEFSLITGIINPSYDDLRDAVSANINISEDFKDILLEGINNLELNEFDIDFSVLYYNLSRLQVVETDSGVLKFLNDNRSTIATFNPTDGQIAIKHANWDEIGDDEKQKIKYTFLHEVLGHGSTEAYVDNNYKSLAYSLVTPIEDLEGKLATIDMVNYGDAFKEGVADIIALKAIDANKDFITYKPFYMELEILLKVLNYSEKDLIDYGVWGLKNEMSKQGIEDPEKYIDRIDTAKMSIATSYEVSEKFDIQGDIIEMLNQIIAKKIKDGVSREDIVLDIVSILDNEITFDYEYSFNSVLLPISVADIKKGIINEL